MAILVFLFWTRFWTQNTQIPLKSVSKSGSRKWSRIVTLINVLGLPAGGVLPCPEYYSSLPCCIPCSTTLPWYTLLGTPPYTTRGRCYVCCSVRCARARRGSLGSRLSYSLGNLLLRESPAQSCLLSSRRIVREEDRGKTDNVERLDRHRSKYGLFTLGTDLGGEDRIPGYSWSRS